MGENPKVVWANFSTLSQAVLPHSNICAFNACNHFQSWNLGPGPTAIKQIAE